MNLQEIKPGEEKAKTSEKHNAQKVRNISMSLRMHFFRIRRETGFMLLGSVLWEGKDRTLQL